MGEEWCLEYEKPPEGACAERVTDTGAVRDRILGLWDRNKGLPCPLKLSGHRTRYLAPRAVVTDQFET